MSEKVVWEKKKKFRFGLRTARRLRTNPFELYKTDVSVCPRCRSMSKKKKKTEKRTPRGQRI